MIYKDNVNKNKICLVCDIPNWAFDKISCDVQKNLNYKYDIIIDYFDVEKEAENFYEFLEKHEDCNLIHFFWRKGLLQFESEIFKRKVIESGKDFDEYLKKQTAKISTGAYDFLGLTGKYFDGFSRVFNNYCKNYCVSSKKLYDAYLKINGIKKPTAIVHDICNWEHFKPYNLERFKIDNRELVIGWVGNSVRVVDGVDLKGFHTIIKPVIQELKDEGYNIKEHYADRQERWRTTEEMPEYYSEIDLCLCTSIHEGTPLPILEAMSCGVPVMTTDVGIVREALGVKQKGYIIGDRENGKNDENIKKILKEKIIELYNNRNILKELSDENLKSIVEYDGGKIIKEFENYFDECLK